MYRLPFAVLPVAFAALILVAVNAPAEPAPIAKVGERTITMEEINDVLGMYPDEQASGIRDNPRNLSKFVQNYVTYIVLADRGRKENLHEQDAVKKRLAYVQDRELAKTFVRSHEHEIAPVTDEDVALYYKIHNNEFLEVEQVKASHILVRVDAGSGDEIKAAARKKAETILAELKGGADFAELAKEKSDDTSSGARGGDLGYFGKGRMVKEFETAAFALKPGELSGIVETTFGYHIIKVTDRKPERTKPLEEVSVWIADKLRTERLGEWRKTFVRKAVEDAGVEFFPDNIPGLRQPGPVQ